MASFTEPTIRVPIDRLRFANVSMYICTNVHTDERRRSRQTCTTKKKLRCLTARTEVRRDRSRDGGRKRKEDAERDGKGETRT